MAQAQAMSNDRKRVKVYELKNNDWYDRGTGFCAGMIVSPQNAPPEHLDARLLVASEDDPNRKLLETRIAKDDGYQKQQETLIVWTENSTVDMALSFQEAEGCAMIWDFVSDVQARLIPSEDISDDLLEPGHLVSLPEPQLGRLDEVEVAMRSISGTPASRDALCRYIMSAEQQYILKLAPLVFEAERLESTPDLHKLCSIMKHLILLNDTAVIEFIVTDDAIMGVVGALEYDPDFPSHRANHRQYLSDSSKFKEVVKIGVPEIRKKIHYTYRLLYLKDVVLARILDDPTFSVLNSLIFFNQVDIVGHVQTNDPFLIELFGILTNGKETASRKKDAVLFIQNCCAVSKNIPAATRSSLYSNFIRHGLFNVITFSLRNHDAAIRVAGTDILVSLIDHDAHIVRNHIFKAFSEKTTPLTDTLIELLLVEVDLGVKSQMADAIKILLDPSSSNAGIEMMNRQGNPELLAKQRGMASGHHPHALPPQTENFISNFYDHGAKRLFQPLKDLERRINMAGLSVQQTSLFTHLVEVLSFFVRQHPYKCKIFILTENLHARIAQLFQCPQKHMKILALKWFRTCIGLQDDFHNRQIVQHRLFEPILATVYETMPKNNLLNSNCLELFEYIQHHRVKPLIDHLVQEYRPRLMGITYVSTFSNLVHRYDQMMNGDANASFATEVNAPDVLAAHRMNSRGQIFSGLQEPDAAEEAYFDGDDDFDNDMIDDDDIGLPVAKKGVPSNGASPIRPLVNYPDDDDDDMDMLASSPDSYKGKKSSSTSSGSDPALTTDSTAASIEEESRGRRRQRGRQHHSPPESLASKRRREELEGEDEDELSKTGGTNKRRNSTASVGGKTLPGYDSHSHPVSSKSATSTPHDSPTFSDAGSPSRSPSVSSQGPTLRRKGSLKVRNEGPTNPGRYAFKPIDLNGDKSPTARSRSRGRNSSAG